RIVQLTSEQQALIAQLENEKQGLIVQVHSACADIRVLWINFVECEGAEEKRKAKVPSREGGKSPRKRNEAKGCSQEQLNSQLFWFCLSMFSYLFTHIKTQGRNFGENQTGNKMVT